jgi:hypothetical protein
MTDTQQRHLAPLGRVEIDKALDRLPRDVQLERYWDLPHKEGHYPSAIVMGFRRDDRTYITWLAYRNGYGLDDQVILESGHYDMLSEPAAMEDARRRVEMHGGSFSRYERIMY